MVIGRQAARWGVTIVVAAAVAPFLCSCSKQGDLVFLCPVCGKEFRVTASCQACKKSHVFKKQRVDDIPQCANCGQLATDGWQHQPCGATARCDSKYCVVRDGT
ncbi:MAG: hypothetical protein A49_28470 [Methyloceanibacter sp.]|nr:MAG: hypothetical protein A49_28470 [Methyloceanibacter sp.]